MTESAVQAGGVLAFAGLVLLLLRQLVPIGQKIFTLLQDLAGEMSELRLTFAAWLERDKRREDRKRRESTHPPMRSKTPAYGAPIRPVPVHEFDDGPSTDHAIIMEEMRKAEAEEKQKRSRGDRAPTRGEHKD